MCGIVYMKSHIDHNHTVIIFSETTMPNKNLKKLSQKALSLPLSPGVYIMKGEGAKIIYIGKARVLKNRVSQYFREAGHPDYPKVQQMVDRVVDFDFIVCSSEFEALILEASLIKQHSPKYNILLKDDKGYHYIKITKGKWPTITAEKQMLDDGAEYLGPYNSGMVTGQTVETAKNVYALPKCNRNFDGARPKRPCLNYSIGLCCAPCVGKVTNAEYRKLVNDAVNFIKKGSQNVIAELEKDMLSAAESLDFERAARLRDRIKAIKKASEKQRVVESDIKEQDVFAVAQTPDAVCVEVFRFSGGRLYDDRHFIMENESVSPEFRAEFLLTFYSREDTVPRQITLDGEVADTELLTKWLSQKADKSVKIVVPQKGEQHNLVLMCKNNASERLIHRKGYGKRDLAVLEELASLLGMSEPPRYIEAYDISHTAGDENVAGMVVFKDAKPFKKAYKHFKIKGFSGQDDYASMHEVIERRISEYNKSETDDGFGKLPDLILLDGGKGQVSAVVPAMRGDFARVGLFGMVKDSRHKTSMLTNGVGDIQIKEIRGVFTLISEIQDEVHRFAIEYHRTRRAKKTLSSVLCEIPTIGEKRAKNLLVKFGSLDKIKNATVDEIAQTPSMTQSSAQTVKDYLVKLD